MRAIVISYAGNARGLRNLLDSIGEVVGKTNPTLKEVFEKCSLIKESVLSEQEFIKAPAKVVKKTAKKLVYKNECCVCGDVWELGKKDDEFVCPTCLENLMYNVKADKLLMIVQDKIQHEKVEELNGIDAVLDIQEIRNNYKALLKKY